MIIDATGATHRGAVRKKNEDNIYINGHYKNDLAKNNIIVNSTSAEEPMIYGVFDGLGGGEYGEITSLMAAESIANTNSLFLDMNIDQVIADLHYRILKIIEEDGLYEMGTTVVLAIFRNGMVKVCNIGDSRAYLFRRDELTQISRDHTHLQSMADTGIEIEDESRRNKLKHQLTQYIGIISEEHVQPKLFKKEMLVNEKDKIILCSDGFIDVIEEKELCCFLKQYKESETEYMVRSLMKEAVRRKCRDNLSLIIIEVKNEMQEEES